MRPLLKDKMPNIESMSYFIMAVDIWLGGMAHERTVQRELAQTKEALF